MVKGSTYCKCVYLWYRFVGSDLPHVGLRIGINPGPAGPWRGAQNFLGHTPMAVESVDSRVFCIESVAIGYRCKIKFKKVCSQVRVDELAS